MDNHLASHTIKKVIEDRITNEHLKRLLLELVTHVNIEAFDRGAEYGRSYLKKKKGV